MEQKKNKYNQKYFTEEDRLKARRLQVRESARRFREKHREKVNEDARRFREKNREKIKEYKMSKKHKPIVYILPAEMYVGVTEYLERRISQHKHYGKDVSGFKIISEHETREDALKVEKQYHIKGYNGKHKNNSYK